MLCAKVGGKKELHVQMSHTQTAIGILDKTAFAELLRHLASKQRNISNGAA